MPFRTQVERIKPPSLRRGDRVGIVAPASYFSRADFDAGCDALRQMGYEPIFDEHIFDRDLYFAGSVERRVRELEAMFAADDIRAILCARGGYGTNYLLPRLNAKKLSATPKIFAGYSDVTCLLTYLADAGMVTFHGPMVVKDFAHDGLDFQSWQAVMEGNPWKLADPGIKGLVPGHAEGILYGGCLSILVASLGTPYEIRTEGVVLFLEDVATKPYQVDRMLMHLKLAGKLDAVRGIVFGEMLNCVQAADQDYSLEDVILRVVGDLGIPIAYGLRSGHVSGHNITLPIGVTVRLEIGTSGVTLEFPESATIV